MAYLVAGVGTTFIVTALGIILFGFCTIVLFESQRPFISTPRRARREIAKYIKLDPHRTIYDLGCGTASLLRALERKFTAASPTLVGIERSLLPYYIAKFLNVIKGSHVHMRREDYFKINLGKADIIYCYLSRSTMKKLGEKFIRECQPGTTVVSYGFEMPGFVPRKTIQNVSGMNLYFYEV